ncbi:MAG: radical SAM family heme chaperone HemW [Gammaproteobacteria bacterium]|nr:radical SAM family heme chaperone HemW [Gammaproteobacteria bacterium]
MPVFTELPPLSLYIHFPWCIQKCPYCDFNSHKSEQTLPEKEYINALLADLENDLPLVWGRKINTIFMGGGTPSLFSPESMEELLNGIRARMPVSPFAEITMEANPGTLDNEKIPGFQQAGINRISLGVQSFNDQHLKLLGRIHDAEKAYNAIELAKKSGFEKINIDLMFGLPEQTLEQAQNDITTAVALGTDHISYYELTLEPNTAFYHKPPCLPDDENIWDIFQQGLNILQSANFQRYEISAYALDKHQCKHNLNYWQFGDYLGIGAGAHAKITDAHQQSVTRYTKTRNPRDYLQGLQSRNFISSQKILDNEHLLFEFLLNALRMTKGFELSLFEKTTGLQQEALLNNLSHAFDSDLLIYDENQNIVMPTNKGLNFLNNILEPLLPQAT